MAKAIRFTNFTDEDFTHTWNSEPYTFPAKETMLLPDWQAAFFAKHLVQRELNKMDEKRGRDGKVFGDVPLREKLTAQCLGTVALEASSVNKLNTTLMNENNALTEQAVVIPAVKFCDSCDSKGKLHKKGCPKKANATVVPAGV